jgi:hypothetical protein
MFLKLKVQQCWGEDMGKENMDVANSNLQYAYPLSPADKQFLRENIFKALLGKNENLPYGSLKTNKDEI